MASRIEDYALIGDCETAALVGQDGSIDWLCWPRFDSGACFAALLGGPEHGRWLLAPDSPVRAVTRRYRPGTLVLETVFTTAEGEVAVIDFMPPRTGVSDLVRLVVGKSGRVAMHTERRLTWDGLILRYDTGQEVDGLPPGEGVFLACSFSLADAYVLMGRVDDAQALFERLLALRNDVGLLAEEYDPRQRRQLGNFPQAFSQVGLINTALNPGRLLEPAEQRARRPVAAGRQGR